MKKQQTETDHQKESEQKLENWFSFWVFIKNCKFSWGWLAILVGFTIWYYSFIPKIPGSTAALFSGKFTNKAIMGVVINYATVLVLLTIINILEVIVTTKSTREVRKTIWNRMMKVETKFYDENGANYLLSSVTSDAQVTVSSLVSLFTSIPGIISYLTTALPMINEFSPKLLWAILILIPIYIIYSILMGRWQYKMGVRIQTKIGGLTGFLTDRIRNLSLIKTFAMESEEETKGLKAANELYDANIEYSYLNAISVGATIILEVLGVIMAVVWGSILLKDGEINLEAWLAFFLFAPNINNVLRQAVSMWNILKDTQGRAIRLGALMEAPQEEIDENNPNKVTLGDIELKNVTFGYKKDLDILKDVSFTIPSGKVTAIVGPTGSGKTTIIRLLEHFYSPNKGSITINGVDLNDVNLYDYRSKVSYVNQSAELFSGTIKEVLTYGLDHEVNEEQLIEATKLAGIYDYVMKQPAGFESELALWGSSLSGGQRQRMVIARELLKNADILILDEATSALDAETACSISQTLFKGFEGKTIITITHELAYISQADQIVVLNQGEIVGIGTHQELMANNELYRKLVEEQSYQEVYA